MSVLRQLVLWGISCFAASRCTWGGLRSQAKPSSCACTSLSQPCDTWTQPHLPPRLHAPVPFALPHVQCSPLTLCPVPLSPVRMSPSISCARPPLPFVPPCPVPCAPLEFRVSAYALRSAPPCLRSFRRWASWAAQSLASELRHHLEHDDLMTATTTPLSWQVRRVGEAWVRLLGMGAGEGLFRPGSSRDTGLRAGTS